MITEECHHNFGNRRNLVAVSKAEWQQYGRMLLTVKLLGWFSVAESDKIENQACSMDGLTGNPK